MDIDHHGPRPISIICHLSDPPTFSLPTTFKHKNTVWNWIPNGIHVMINLKTTKLGMSKLKRPTHFASPVNCSCNCKLPLSVACSVLSAFAHQWISLRNGDSNLWVEKTIGHETIQGFHFKIQHNFLHLKLISITVCTTTLYRCRAFIYLP
jgi:hypothetical protein